MYYEYHLKNGNVITNEHPYINGFYVNVGEQAYCPDLEEWYEVDSFIEVRYCMVREDVKPLSKEEREDVMESME